MSTSDNEETISDTVRVCSDSASSRDSSENRELQPLDKAKSDVWQYFGFPATTNGEKDKKKHTEVLCKRCPKRINYQGSTTNMMVHLQYNHCAEYMKVKSKSAIQDRSSSQTSSK